MVMITRSAFRKAIESSNSSDLSEKNIIPPWCSSGKVQESRKSRKLGTDWEIRSTYPCRQNIWEYLYEDKANFNCSSKRKRKAKVAPAKNNCCWKTTAILAVLLASTGMFVSLWMTNTIPGMDLINKIFPSRDLISIIGIDTSTSVTYECCQRLKYLTEELWKAEQSLRNTLKRRRTMMLITQTKKIGPIPTKHIDTRRIEGATATKGADTVPWDGRVALWGIVPLWRAAPPADIILAARKPTVADCWPFIGSYGEIVIRLPRPQAVRYVSVEHIKPDTARSAPKHFLLFGILANNTWIQVVNGRYRAEGPAKQYYPLTNRDAPLRSLVFRVLTNQGNEKYTCVYRVHFYGRLENGLI